MIKKKVDSIVLEFKKSHLKYLDSINLDRIEDISRNLMAMKLE